MDADRPGIRYEDTGQQADRGGLSCPVGTEEPEDLTFRDLKADIVDGGYGAEAFDQVFDMEGVHDWFTVFRPVIFLLIISICS
jgi:hypothetical protein